MKLSDGEKLILMMLADMYKHMGIKNGEFDPDFITNTIVSDHLWGFNWRFTGIPFEREETPRDVKETADYLDMWMFLERSYEDLSAADKTKVNAATERQDLKFPGFDGNHEDHFGIARYFVDDLQRWEHFKGRDLNSHMQSVDGYRLMFRVFEPLRSSVLGSRLLNVDEIISVMTARRLR